MEKVNIRSKSGMMKMTGVTLCIGGVATIAFYRGQLLQLFHHHQNPSSTNHTWIKGVFLMLLSNIAWAFWLVFQGRVLKSYPWKLLLTTLQCFLSTIQSFVAALAFARDLDLWKLGWNIPLLSVAYGGIVVTGVTLYMQAWVIKNKGPVFLAMTTPLIMSAFVLGETISLGSVLGVLSLVGGIYFVSWGKRKEEEGAKAALCHLNFDEEKACGELKGDSDEKACEETKPEIKT